VNGNDVGSDWYWDLFIYMTTSISSMECNKYDDDDDDDDDDDSLRITTTQITITGNTLALVAS
jgi:hypothetical protein